MATKATTTKTKTKAKTARTKSKSSTSDMVAVLPSTEKQKIIDEYATKKGDTGSPEVQIALLTKRIEKLVGHLKINPTDNHSRRGLLGMLSKRRRLLNYLAEKDATRFKHISSKLELVK